MFKRVNYSKRALSTFEIVGSFIVDLYYNHFYQEAKRIRIEGRVESVTDGYKHSIKAYLNSFQNPDSYKKTIVGIHKYYYTTTRFSTISFSECVNEIVKHFIPEDFFESTTNQQRDGLLHKVLLNAVKQFSSDVLCSNILDTLIDNHSDVTIVRNMQDKMVEALMFEREKMFQKIFNVSNKPKDGGNFTVVMKMKTEMIKLVKENHSLTGKYAKLKEKALGLLEIAKEQKEKLEKMEEPNNNSLERSEYQHDKYINTHRQQQYDAYHPEQNFDRYRDNKNTAPDTDDKTLIIPNDDIQHQERYPYRRPPRTDSTYMAEPPLDNTTRFRQYHTNVISESTNNYGPPPEANNDNVMSHVFNADHTPDPAPDPIPDPIPNPTPDPALSMGPLNDDFFGSGDENMLNIN